MARRKNIRDHIRNIQKSKGSYHVSIPMSLMKKLKWQERQKVSLKQNGRNKILISDWKK